MRVIGERSRSVDWDEKTSGRARYSSDALPPGTLVGKVLRSPHPHAHIRSIDIRAALRVEGVRAVITAADFPPGARYRHLGPAHADRPPLADGVVRFAGQEVAAVAATTAEAAERALHAIRVGYERLPAPLTIHQARDESSPELHPRSSGEHNVAVRTAGSWGDPEEGEQRSQHTARGRYVYPRVNHACMEPHTTLAQWHTDPDRIELWTSTQAPWFVQEELAHVFGLDPSMVVCRDVAVGGGFGSKSKVCEQESLAAALSRSAGAPVLVALDRTEEFTSTKPRHRFEVDITVHGDAEGTLRRFDADVVVDNGAYNHYGPNILNVGIKALGLTYRPDGVRWSARLVDTALAPGGQFRGYGTPQTTFALESAIDDLAHQIGMDPLELRLRNANQPGSVTLAGARLTTCRLTECLEAVRDAIDWDAKRRNPTPNRGVGVAVAMHGSGSFAFEGANRSEAAIDLHADGRILVRFGGADAGTGQRTVLAQVVAEELGVDVDAVDVLMIDGELTPFDQGAWSSRGTHMGGHAARTAAADLAERLRTLAAEKLGTPDVRLEGGAAVAPTGTITLGDLVAISPGGADGALTQHSVYIDPTMEPRNAGNPTPNYSASYTYAAHAVEVEVDPLTGEVHILDYVAAHDIGQVINPAGAEGQVVGGVVQGLGAALGEELVLLDGRVVNQAFLYYGLPRAADAPRVRTIFLEGADPAGPYGAKSVGELPIAPPAPAVANAIFAATGIRFHELPITPDKVLAALAERDGAHRDHRLRFRPSRWQIAAFRWLYPRGLHAALERSPQVLSRSKPTRPVAALEHPGTLDELIAGSGHDGAVLGGGTDLLQQRRDGVASPVRLLSVRDIADLHTLEVAADGSLRIGAAVTLAELERSPLTPPVLRDVIATIASPQIREQATVAGNLLQEKRCWFFRNGFDCYKRGGWSRPCYAVDGDHRFHHAAMEAHRCQAVTPSDLATVLTALDAGVQVAAPGGAHRRVPVGDLYRGPAETTLADGEVITSIDVAEVDLHRIAAFQKLALWTGDFAVVSVAVTAREASGSRTDHRLVVGALAPTPRRSPNVERCLDDGAGPDTVVSAFDRELTENGHPLARNGWKLDAAVGLLTRALEDLGGARG